IHDQRAVHADHVDFLAVRAGRGVADHVVPPGVLDVLLEFDAERAVVPEAVDAAVDQARRVDEAGVAAEGGKLFHVDGHKRLSCIAASGYRGQWLWTMPAAARSTRSGSRRNSGTRKNRSTSAAARISAS